MHMPWGQSQTVKELAPGIVDTTTASHGGLKLSPARWEKLLEVFPRFQSFAGPGWLEEDCDYMAAVYIWPELFPGVKLDKIREYIRGREDTRTPASPEPLRQPQAQLFGEDAGGFCLVAEVTTDGARIIREREEKASNQKQESQKQKELFV
jgi:hypothetical protein